MPATAADPATTPPQASTDADVERGALPALLEHRFRHTLRSGQLSPLLHLILRYQQETLACTRNN